MCFELPPCLFRMQMANRGDEARTNVGIHPVRILPIAFPAICIYMPQHSFAGSGLAYHNVTDSFCHLMSYFSWWWLENMLHLLGVRGSIIIIWSMPIYANLCLHKASLFFLTFPLHFRWLYLVSCGSWLNIAIMFQRLHYNTTWKPHIHVSREALPNSFANLGEGKKAWTLKFSVETHTVLLHRIPAYPRIQCPICRCVHLPTDSVTADKVPPAEDSEASNFDLSTLGRIGAGAGNVTRWWNQQSCGFQHWQSATKWFNQQTLGKVWVLPAQGMILTVKDVQNKIGCWKYNLI